VETLCAIKETPQMIIRPNYYKTNFLVFFLLLVTLYSCGESPGELVKKELSTLNIPTHTFKMSYARLKDTIPSLFTFEKQYENKYLERFFFYYFPENDKSHKHLISFSAETSKDRIFSVDDFKKPNTKEDIYLTTMGEHWKSPVYYAKEKPLLYTTAFICKFKKIDNYNTQFTVFAENPFVVNGTDG
jgi:hypothetical protein